MKRKYETPEVKKVEFDYTQNVVASGAASQTQGQGDKCYVDPCTGATRECNVFSNTQCSRP